jgi:hypothetical protein
MRECTEHRDAADDLAEGERHDGDVVGAWVAGGKAA